MKPRTQPVTPTRMRLPLAAKMMGVSRSQAYRRLRQYAVFSDGPNSRLEVDSARVYKFIASERHGEQPMMPELRRIDEKMGELDNGQEKLYGQVSEVRGIAERTWKTVQKLATRMGMAV